MLRVIALLALAVVAPLAQAEVVSVGVINRQPWAGGERFDQVGAYEVLRGTVRAERVAHNRPRRSIEERYANRDGFMTAVAKAIDDAVDKRFLLPIQREAVLARMGRHWDDTMAFGWYLGRRIDP